ncbi:hypothetical protein [Sulfitobacter sp. R18_1]|uniref:hypothetical protein n=1 Tax=Sulfitobacter sp. R18_1 TaxID=2821104 RepID=UPI001AD953F4|nr:hypothetical protein [Sulfitobacter sp. R18_1]MBO9428615.1 hypothetical protein [Sulfitobacter sp. R18_1]
MAFKGWVIDPTIIDWKNGNLKEGFKPEDIIQEAEFTDYDDIYKVLSYEGRDVDYYEVVYLANAKGDCFYVDGEGLFSDQVYWFKITGGHQPFGGKGFVLGEDEEGASISPKVTTKEWLLENIAVAANNIELKFERVDDQLIPKSRQSVDAPFVGVWMQEEFSNAS